MKISAIAPANIAFIKYWGKADENLRLPLNSSLSMNLSGTHTTTTVAFSKDFSADSIELVDGAFSADEKARITLHLDRIRSHAGISDRARVVTQNSFPKGTGIASSASGFAALTVAASAAAGLELSEKELSIMARLGSGSAARSIPDGFVLWQTGESSETSYAYSLYGADYWDLRDVLVIVDSVMKQTSSSSGMRGVKTSPLWSRRVSTIPQTIEQMRKAFDAKNFSQLGELIEADCLSMHAVAQSQTPALQYWSEETIAIMDAVKNWRARGLAVYYTIDAGPNVHVICEEKNEQEIVKRIHKMSGIQQIIINKPAKRARLVNEHLF